MCDTQYTFFQYFLLTSFDVFKDTFFVFDACFSTTIVENLEKSGMACHQQTYFGMPFEKKLQTLYANQDYLEKIIKGFYDYFNGEVCVYGQDHLETTQILWRENLLNIPFILLEDGTGNYIKKEKLSKKQSMKSDEYTMGHNSRVTKIYLTGMWKIPNDIKSKVQIMDLRLLWERKSAAEKQFFLNLYFIDENELNVTSGKSVCFLGGPFSNFGFMPKEEELKAYRKIISNFNSSELYIKVHPTGFNIDYNKEFPGINVLMNPIPFEVIYFLTGHQLKTIASMGSSASMIADEHVEQQFYDLKGNRIELRYPLENLV